jgi:hypothetical protein
LAIQILYRAQAFGPGNELWVIPGGTNTPLFKKMDWYLNFQISRARTHKSEELAPQLKTIMTESQLQSLAPHHEESTALMVAAEHHFPTKKVIEVPVKKNKESWAKDIQEIWSGLNKPSLRVFLPPQISAEEFKSFWPGPKNEDVMVVPS